MSSRQLFVVLVKVLGLYVLSGHALTNWVGFFVGFYAENFVGNAGWDRALFSLTLPYALSHTAVGLCFLFGAEQIADVAGMSHSSSTSDDTEHGR